MNEISFDIIDTPWEYFMAMFPPEKIGLIVMIAAAVFALTQVIKVVFRGRRLPTLGPTSLRLIATISAFPITMGVWPVQHPGSIAAVALIAWGIAHLIAEKGMAFLQEFFPRVYRVLNAEPDRRLQNKGPERGQYERRRDGSGR